MLANWKTTLVGIVGAVFSVVWPLVSTGGVDIKDVISAGVLAILGYLAKDAGVTGTKI